MVLGSIELSPNGALSQAQMFGDLSQGHVFPVVEVDNGELTRTE
jgi:hypothetical protein